MRKKTTRSNRGNRRRSQEISIQSDFPALIREVGKHRTNKNSISKDLSNLIHETAKCAVSRKLNFKEGFSFVNSYLKILEKHILEKDIKNALTAQTLIDYIFYSTVGVPLYMWFGARKGGQADKTKKGIWAAIEKNLPQRKIKTPSRVWKYFEMMYSGDGEDKAYWTPDLNYKIWFARDVTDRRPNGGYLIQKSFDGKQSSITFKTFEKYFYKIKHNMDLAQA
jgi:hypothetical protein